MKHIAVTVEFNEHFQQVDAYILGIYGNAGDVPEGELYVSLPEDDSVSVSDCYVKFHFETSTSQTPNRVELLRITEDEDEQGCKLDDENVYSLNDMINDLVFAKMEEY